MYIGCSPKEWTEGVSKSGFKTGLDSRVRYKKGGKTTFKVQLESEIFTKLGYPIELIVYLNGEVCSEGKTLEPKGEIFNSVECSSFLGKGLHTFNVVVSSPNGFGYISDNDDLMFNAINGAITYTIEND